MTVSVSGIDAGDFEVHDRLATRPWRVSPGPGANNQQPVHNPAFGIRLFRVSWIGKQRLGLSTR